MRRGNTELQESDEPTHGDGPHEQGQKQTTLAAVSNAAMQAKQWGWNAYQRHKEARRQAEQANHLDLSQPMGRGQPLPPLEHPLPKPTNGMTRIGPPVNVPARKPVPSHGSAESLDTHHEHHHEHHHENHHEHHHEHHNEHRPALPPTLHQRGRRRQSHAPEPDIGQNMLVVAAPDDSQPTTPSAEDHSNRQPWASSGEQTMANSTATSQQPSTLTPESSIMKDDGSSVSPIEALPAASAAADDDDDYSGWLDKDALDMEINDPVQLPVSQEVK
ncbi:hypothetical protein NW754_015575 [Fusarium falciforme]|nr:hypothetical protein NW754_015575 [Fusarium falciforme]